MNKKLLFVTSRLPWPTNSGRKVSLYQYCRGLAVHCGYEVSLFVFPEWDQPRSDDGKPDFVQEVRFAQPIGRATKLKNLLFHSLLGKKQPFQCSLYESKKNRRALADFVSELAPDVILFDMVRLAPYMEDFLGRVRCILDLDDLLSVRYLRQLEAFDDDVGIAGRYAGGMGRLTERIACHGRLGKRILRAEQRRMARAELHYTKLADGAILVSNKEAARLNEALGEPRAVSVPTAIDVTALAHAKDIEKAPRTFGFVGNLFVAANVASLELIVRDILPRIGKDFCFEVAGPVPEAVRTRFADIKELTFLGEVKTLVPVLGRWQFALAPIAFGSGLKTKVLEAMAAHLPVITNALGAEGIAAAHEEEIFINLTPDAFAATARTLLEDPVLCRTVGENAARFVAAHFAPEVTFAAFKKLDL